jgi:hypothetical protein
MSNHPAADSARPLGNGRLAHPAFPGRAFAFTQRTSRTSRLALGQPWAVVSVFTIIEGECFRISEGVAGDSGWSCRVVTAERL